MKENKQYNIYILTNKSNKVIYIGVTNDLERRMFEQKINWWKDLQKGITPIEPKNTSSPHGGGGFRWGGRSGTSTPILPFPHHKGEGNEIRENHIDPQNHC